MGGKTSSGGGGEETTKLPPRSLMIGGSLKGEFATFLLAKLMPLSMTLFGVKTAM